jgi:hypothetical protein
MSNFFEQFKGDSKKGDKKEKKNENPLKNIKNPFAQIGKGIGGQRKFGGEGQSLGGSRPGRLIHMSIDQQGPLGVKVRLHDVCVLDDFSHHKTLTLEA